MSLVKIANKLPKLNGKFFGAYVLPPIPTYKITLLPSQNGSISADTLEGIEGTLVTLSNIPDTHYSFGGYGITGATLTGNQFLIGQDDISVQGSFIEDAKYSLSLTQVAGGSINANNNTGYGGTTNPSFYLSTFNMFTIGTTNIKPLTLWGELYLQPEYNESTTKISRQNIIPNKIMLGSSGKPNVGAYPWDGDGEYEGYPAGFMKDPNSLYGWIITDAPKIFRTDHKTNWWQALTVDINIKWYIKK